MTERKLPPVLEEKVQFEHGDAAPYLWAADLLDWLYGTAPANKYGAPFSGLVERVEQRMYLYKRQVMTWEEALRAELGEEA